MEVAQAQLPRVVRAVQGAAMSAKERARAKAGAGAQQALAPVQVQVPVQEAVQVRVQRALPVDWDACPADAEGP